VDILFLSLKGGSGGTWSADGYDHIGLINCAGGILAQDYEMFEIHDPHFLVKHEYLQDSAGAGRWRGGVGVETEFEIRGENVTGVAFGDGVEEEARAFGLFGGKSGSRNEIRLDFPDGSARLAKTKEIVRGIPRGTRFRQKAGGGGGYGDPFARPPGDVLADVRDELVSVEAAREQYGVWIDPRTLVMDAKKTAAMRGTRARARDKST
jgi:N-methylhydantoinase B